MIDSVGSGGDGEGWQFVLVLTAVETSVDYSVYWNVGMNSLTTRINYHHPQLRENHRGGIQGGPYAWYKDSGVGDRFGMFGWQR